MKNVNKSIITSVLVVLLTWIFTPDLLAQDDQFQSDEISRQRIAQTGMKFLNVSLDAKAAALGDAMTAQQLSSVGMLYNPASMAYMTSNFDLSLGQTQWIADVNYNMFTAAYNSPIGVFGLFGIMVNYGEILETIRADNNDGFLDMGSITPTANAFGVGYARALSDRFSIGANAKYVSQDFGESTIRLDEGNNPVQEQFDLNTIAVDFGMLYQTGFKSLNFAMSVRNFARELTYSQESFELPLTFRIGLSMDMMDVIPLNSEMHSLHLSIDTERPRDYYENIRVGGEYVFMNTFAVRAGYVAPHDTQGLNAGFGLANNLGGIGFNIDYSYSQYDTFGNVNRLVVGFQF